MSQNSRRHRAAKQRAAQQRQHTPRQTARPPEPPTGDPWRRARPLNDAVRALALGMLDLATGKDAARCFVEFTAFTESVQRSAVEACCATIVGDLVERGWCPTDLAEIARRRAPAPCVPVLMRVVAAYTAAHPRSRVDSRWFDQLEGSGASLADPVEAADHGTRWPTVFDAVGLLVELSMLPKLHPVLPAPGTAAASASSSRDSQAVDATVLRRVRALLAKAESTDFEEEAEAFSAKAQSMMRQHSIDRAMAESDEPARVVSAARRLWLDNPYLAAKSVLVNQVAGANRCRSVFTEALGFVTVLGFEADLDTVELLTTSLLLQAERGLRIAGRHTTRSGVSRTRSFRQSYLLAYAGRIGERLRESTDAADQAGDVHHGGALLPVLAARERVVQDAFEAAFPQTVSREVRVSNSAGWGAGRAAADLAQLNTRRSLDAESA